MLVLACFLTWSPSCSGFGRVFAISCLCLGRVGSEEKWVDDTSLCPVFMLYQNRGARRHHADICDYLPGRWILFSVINNSFFLWYKKRWQEKNYLIWRREALRFDSQFFFPMCEVCNIWVALTETNWLLSLPAEELWDIKWKHQEASLKTKLREVPPHTQNSQLVEDLTARQLWS